MSRATLKRQLREQRRALRASVAQMKRDARERLEQNPAVRREKLRKRIRRAITAVAVLLLILLVRCDCSQAPAPLPPAEPARVEAPKPAPTPPAKPPKLTGKVKTQPRGKYENDARKMPSWLEAFHVQVSARSSRLAECFTGTDRPGAIRWAAALNAKSGAVSDHELEPLGVATSFTGAQRDCVVSVLSSPTYRLKLAENEPLPNRVSLVIEF